jgi:hypothetical protein
VLCRVFDSFLRFRLVVIAGLDIERLLGDLNAA